MAHGVVQSCLIRVQKLEQLKAYHNMNDTETKYRQRYVDLIMNEKTRDTFRKRSLIIQKVREYLTKQGFDFLVDDFDGVAHSMGFKHI